jgi:two-component system phosphate regulon sensor histidine kinase PhoR
MKRLWNNSLVAKVFLSYLAVVVLLFASFYLFSSYELKQRQITAIGQRMGQEARFLTTFLPAGVSGEELDALCRRLGGTLGTRITVVDVSGKVLGDSAEPSASMENHVGRPEVVEALRRGDGSATRYSTTVRHEMLYHAFYDKSSTNPRIVRVAKPLQEVESAIQSMRWSILTGLLFASGLGLVLAWFFSRHLSQRFRRLEQFTDQVAQGSFPQNFFPVRAHDEISVLEQRLTEMSLKIRDNLQLVVDEKEKADSILRCMIEGVLVLDPKGQVLVMNDQARAMFHVPPKRAIAGASMLEISRHPEMQKILAEVLAFDFTKQRYSKEVELDEERWFRVNAVRLRDFRGASLGSILVFHDVTDIKRFESMRSDFVANVSHELRTPLTAIRGYVETLLDTPPADPEDGRQFLAIIDRHSERLSRLTEDLLTLSDLESGNIRLTLHALDPNQLIQGVLEIFWDRAAKKHIRLNHHPADDLPRLQGDLDRLQQLFINLVDNAIKYTPPGGGVSLTAAAAVGKNGAPQIEIAVADTGPGIPEKDLPRLTERFYRVDKARSRDLGGTGLGLAIVKHIVQAHKGELKIESTLNKGTTVRVFLPAAANHRGILFLCRGNSCRSQMAEGFARRLANGTRIYSAGTEPKEVHPLAALVMEEAGVDIAAQRAKGLDAIPLEHVDTLITLCDDGDCPVLTHAVKRAHWALADPAQVHGTDAEILHAFRAIRDEIRARVEELFSRPLQSS